MIKYEIWVHSAGTAVKRSSHASRIRAARLARALNATQPIRFTVRASHAPHESPPSTPLRHPR